MRGALRPVPGQAATLAGFWEGRTSIALCHSKAMGSYMHGHHHLRGSQLAPVPSWSQLEYRSSGPAHLDAQDPERCRGLTVTSEATRCG
jgi:hypothetical protein